MSKNYLKIADTLYRKRVEKGLSRRRIALLAGISDTEIRRIEEGYRRVYNLETLINLCKILDINFNDLLKYAGYFDDDNIKNYRVLIKKESEYVIENSALTEAEACEGAIKELEELQKIDPNFDTNIEISVEEIQ